MYIYIYMYETISCQLLPGSSADCRSQAHALVLCEATLHDLEAAHPGGEWAGKKKTGSRKASFGTYHGRHVQRVGKSERLSFQTCSHPAPCAYIEVSSASTFPLNLCAVETLPEGSMEPHALGRSLLLEVFGRDVHF